MTTNQHKPLAIGLNKTVIVEPALDIDGDLELELEADCDSGGHYVFLPLSDQIALRDHLDRLIGDKK